MVKRAKKAEVKDQLDIMLNTLENAITLLQDNINKEVKKSNLDVVAATKVFKLIADSLGQIYKIKCGKAAQERIIQQIGELQLEMSKVEQINAERERRARSKPFIDIIGDLVEEEEIIADDPQPQLREEHNQTMRPSVEGKATQDVEKAVESGLRRSRNGSQR